MDSESSSSASIPPSCLTDSYGTSLRDASFSSYLNSTEEGYIHDLVKVNRVDDDEIDVFSADKYFKGVIDQESNGINTAKYKQRLIENQTNDAMVSLSKIKLQPRTPRTRSESSCNSQSALLGPVESNPVKGVKKPSFISWYCCDKKSVDVDENVEFISKEDYGGIPKIIKTEIDATEITRLNKLRLIESGIDPFLLPGSGPVKSVKKSLGVFGAMETNNDGINKFSLEKRLNLLPWEKSIESYNETDSDASSDLFEIECFSCTGNPIEGHGPRNGLNNGNVSPTIGYAPSEVSVDWSVVTASAADFSEQGSTITSVTRPRMSPKSKPAAKTGINKGILSGCTTQKAVMVASDVYRSNEKRKSSGEKQRTRKFSDSYGSMTRFHAEAKLHQRQPLVTTFFITNT